MQICICRISVKIKIGDITKIRTGKLDANAADENGQYPFFTCSKEPLKINTYSYDCECVLVAGNGDLNVKYYNGKFDAYQRTYIIEDDSDGLLFMPYLYFFMESYIDELRKQSIGGVIKYIKLKNLTDALIELPSIEVQRKIVNIISKSKEIVRRKENEFELLDELVRARFVEMFGDPVDNPMNWKKKKLKDIVTEDCTISYGIVQTGEEQKEGIPVFRPVDIVNHTPKVEELKKTTEFISDRYKKTLLKGHELLITVRANIADTFIADKEFMGCNVGRGIVPIRTQEDIMRLEFLKCLIDNRHLNDILKSKAKGITLIQLNMEDLRNVELIIPPIDLQIDYLKYSSLIDKSRSRIQKSLEASQELFESLMQEYFG